MVCVSYLHSNTCPRLLTHPLRRSSPKLIRMLRAPDRIRSYSHTEGRRGSRQCGIGSGKFQRRTTTTSTSWLLGPQAADLTSSIPSSTGCSLLAPGLSSSTPSHSEVHSIGQIAILGIISGRVTPEYWNTCGRSLTRSTEISSQRDSSSHLTSATFHWNSGWMMNNICLIKDGRATIGVQQPSSDPPHRAGRCHGPVRADAGGPGSSREGEGQVGRTTQVPSARATRSMFGWALSLEREREEEMVGAGR